MVELRKEVAAFWPKKFIESQYSTDKMSFVEVQVDKIMAFSEVS